MCGRVAVLLAIIIAGWISAAAGGGANADLPPRSIAGGSRLTDARLARALEQAAAALSSWPGGRDLMSPCADLGSGTWPGLEVADGRVVAARLLDEIGGFAKTAGVTGGQGGLLKVVSTTADYDPRSPPIPGSLRAAISDLVLAGSPGWIVFGRALGPRAKIALTAPLRLPDNVTLDGACADVTLESPSRIGLVYIFGTRNVVVSNLAFAKTDYAAGAGDDVVESCIRLNGSFDAVAIVHNDLTRCGDGAIDATVSPRRPLPDRARATVAYNYFHGHDKTMLFGTFGCANESAVFGQSCDEKALANGGREPALYLTLEGNLFLRTGQRHPRVYGLAYAHIINNVIVFERQVRANGSLGSAYGVFVSNGAQALIENNMFWAAGRNPHPSAVWTASTPGTERMPEDFDGSIRLGANLTSGREIIAANSPATVPDPPYFTGSRRVLVAGTDPGLAIVCVAARAGRGGAAEWDLGLCI